MKVKSSTLQTTVSQGDRIFYSHSNVLSDTETVNYTNGQGLLQIFPRQQVTLTEPRQAL